MGDGNLEVKLDPEYFFRAHRPAVQVKGVTTQATIQGHP